MKSQEFNSTINSSKLYAQSSLFDSKSLKKPLCPGKNQATHLCLNPICKELNEGNQDIPTRGYLQTSKHINNSFICSNDKCQFCCTPDEHQWNQIKRQAKSGRAHEGCFMTSYGRLLFCIKRKAINTQPLKKQINKIFNSFIDYLSDLRQKYLNELNYYGLSQNQHTFLSCFDKGQFEQITPELGLQIVNQLPNQMEDNILKVKKILENYWKEQEGKAKDIFDLIGKEISMEEIDRIEEVKMDSMIVVSEQEKFNLIKMIQNHQNAPVRSLNLLYRASQNEFDCFKFHQKCDLIEHTVVVIQTEHGKKIGGYTPIVWEGEINEQYSRDYSGKSFVFSLTNNQKFNLLSSQEQNAIYQTSEDGPIFGGNYDIYISDNGNINYCWANINTSYTHPEYKNEDQESWKKFSGAIGTNNFRVNEWEVFEVIWE